MAVGATSVSLQSATDDDGVALPAGVYFFAIDGNNSQKEHIVGTLSGTTLTSISSVSRQGVQASGVVRTHRVGATVTLTDFAHIKYLNDLLTATTDLDSTTPLKYDGTATISNANHLATKAYVDGVAIAGAPDASTTVKGITKMSVAPASATAPIAVGDNDNRVSPVSLASLTANRVAALAGTGTPSATDPYLNVSTISGAIVMWGGPTAPTGWLLCDGSAVSRSTYSTLFSILFPTLGTVTITIAVPGVVSLTAHGLASGDAIYLTTTGALPTGLSANTRYWIIKNDANSFWLATSLANALAGTKITTTGSQSGTHTAVRASFGIGDGSTTFNLPSLKGNVPAGLDQSQSEFAGLGQTGGEKTHTLTTTEMPAHTHTVSAGGGSTSNPGGGGNVALTSSSTSGSTGGDGAHNNLQPYITLTFIIKT